MKRGTWRLKLVTGVLTLCGCVGSSSSLLGAVVNTGIAMGTSAHSRSKGGCYASCPQGTSCNKKTGYCDALPCRGECRTYEQCVEGLLTYRCEAPMPDVGDIIVQPRRDPP